MASGEMVARWEVRNALTRLESSLRDAGHMSAAYGVRLATDAVDAAVVHEGHGTIAKEPDPPALDFGFILLTKDRDALRAALSEDVTVSILSIGDGRVNMTLPRHTLNAARAAVGLEPL